MAQFVMVMMGSASSGDWDSYIDRLIQSGSFRGGSSLGRGARISKDGSDGDCSVTGYMRLEVADLDEARKLVAGNPLYEAGGYIELLEEIPDE